MLRIATYNLWNAKRDWPSRLAGAAEELTRLEAGIVALQEAPVEASPGLPIADYLRQHTPYAHVLHLPYLGPADRREWPEGLAFLSTSPFQDVRTNWDEGTPTENSWGARVVMAWHGTTISITNVHLDFRHAASRERHIVRIVHDLIEAPAGNCDLDILCGDFNDDGDAPTLRYLAGETALDGHRTRWRDLVAEWHDARGETPPVTLDFETNPRWRVMTITDPSKRFDRIYLRSRHHGATIAGTPRVIRSGLFGKVPTNSLGVVPSDHYGVFVDLIIQRHAASG
jgi:endonuclease/exonuclease/phosphatase family metal-dependent hydrolase